MKAIDTNVLLRYLVKDDPKQFAAAQAYIEKYGSAEHPIFINRIVLCETVWVLGRLYRYNTITIANVIEAVLRAEEFAVENSGAAWLALEDYRKSKADFADALIGRVNKAAGYAKTGTLDIKAAMLEAFEEV